MPRARLKIIPLGGLNEIGKNMMMMEYENDIIIIDAGHMFPEEKVQSFCRLNRKRFEKIRALRVRD